MVDSEPKFTQPMIHPDILFSGEEFVGENGYRSKLDENRRLRVLIPFDTKSVAPTDNLGDRPLTPDGVKTVSDEDGATVTRSTGDAGYEVEVSVKVKGNGPMPDNPLEFLQKTFSPSEVRQQQIGAAARSSQVHNPSWSLLAQSTQEPTLMDFARPYDRSGVGPLDSHGPLADTDSESKAKAPLSKPKKLKPQVEKKLSFGFKQGSVHLGAVAVAMSAALVMVVGLGVETLSDAKRAGETCITPLTVALKQATGVDASQACESAIMIGDMTNPLNLLTIFARHK